MGLDLGVRVLDAKGDAVLLSGDQAGRLQNPAHRLELRRLESRLPDRKIDAEPDPPLVITVGDGREPLIVDKVVAQAHGQVRVSVQPRQFALFEEPLHPLADHPDHRARQPRRREQIVQTQIELGELDRPGIGQIRRDRSINEAVEHCDGRRAALIQSDQLVLEIVERHRGSKHRFLRRGADPILGTHDFTHLHQQVTTLACHFDRPGRVVEAPVRPPCVRHHRKAEPFQFLLGDGDVLTCDAAPRGELPRVGNALADPRHHGDLPGRRLRHLPKWSDLEHRVGQALDLRDPLLQSQHPLPGRPERRVAVERESHEIGGRGVGRQFHV